MLFFIFKETQKLPVKRIYGVEWLLLLLCF